jgi:DNA-binding IclR family transcriptional regulator
VVMSTRSPAVPRAIAILEDIGRQGPSTISEIAARTSIARSSVSDLCVALSVEHLLRRQPELRFGLGRTFVQIAAGLTQGMPLMDAFVANCEKVAELADHTITLNTLYCGEALCIGVRHGRLPLPLTPRVGRRMELTRTNTGQAIILGGTIEELATHFEVFGSLFATPTPSIQSVLDQRRRLEETGISSIVMGTDEGHGYELACPIRNQSQLLGAVALMFPSAAIDQNTSDQLIAGLKRLVAILERVQSPEA